VPGNLAQKTQDFQDSSTKSTKKKEMHGKVKRSW